MGWHTSGWKAWLHLEAAVGYLAPPPAPFAEDGTYLGDDWSDPDYEREANAVKEQILAETPGGSAAAADAIAWAHEAGLEPGSLEEVTEALNGHEVFVEDLFYALINRLGIATDEVEIPVRPAIVEVLRDLLGHRLNAVDTTSHLPTRGERLAFPSMLDLRFHFDRQPPVTACGCGEEFSLLLTSLSDDVAGDPEQQINQSLHQAFLDVVGQRLTDAATVRHRYLPTLKGTVLRFGNRDLFIAAIDGRWAIATGSTPPTQLTNERRPHPENKIHVNPWLAT